MLLTERGAGAALSQLRYIHAEEDVFRAPEALRSRGGSDTHGSVGRGLHTVTTVQPPVCHLSHMQEDGRTVSQVETPTFNTTVVGISSLFVCLSVCLSVSNFAQKLPNGFA